MNALDYAAPFLGAITLEVVHWYGLRGEAHTRSVQETPQFRGLLANYPQQ